MKSLELEKQIAVLQLVYQLIVSADGCMNEQRDNVAIDFALSELGYKPEGLGGNVGNMIWNKATEANPFEAFSIVSHLDNNIKMKFKDMILRIAAMGGNKLFRQDIARQIFIRTRIN